MAQCLLFFREPTEATINGAYALNMQELHGSITTGKKADLLLTKPVASLDFLPYAYGSNLIQAVFIGGKVRN